jgi:peroxiredoxin
VSSADANISPHTRADGDGYRSRTLRRVIWAMAFMLGVSLITNLLLAYRVKTLGDSMRELNAPPPGLEVGTTVSPIKAHTLGGQTEVISYAEEERPVVLYVFTPQCSWCARNLANFKALLAHERGTYRFVGLSLTDKDLQDYAAKNQLDCPIYFNPAEETMREYKLGGTPQTIVISREGKVLKNWVGAYTGQQQTEVEQFFQLSLPGMTPGN